LDNTTKLLFGRFPREMFSWRTVVHSLDEMEKLIQYHNGIDDLYTSVYSSNLVLDRIFFDFDYGDHLLQDAKDMVNWCNENQFQTVPIVSGKKGLHIYIITKPKIYGPEAKINLTRAAYSILKSVYGPFKQISHPNNEGKLVRKFRTKDGIIGPDPAVVGDIKRISRLPNSLRPPENLNYCTYLPPNNFLDMTKADIIAHQKSMHHYDYKINFRKAPLLTSFEYDFEDTENGFMQWESLPKPEQSAIGGSNPNIFLKLLLRPCLYRHITYIHPSNEVRVACTYDLVSKGYTVNQIVSLYSTLGWEDFLEQRTRQQVQHCYNDVVIKGYKPYSCGKLRSLSIPLYCCEGNTA